MRWPEIFGLSTFPVFRRPKQNRKKIPVTKPETFAKPKPKGSKIPEFSDHKILYSPLFSTHIRIRDFFA